LRPGRRQIGRSSPFTPQQSRLCIRRESAISANLATPSAQDRQQLEVEREDKIQHAWSKSNFYRQIEKISINKVRKEHRQNKGLRRKYPARIVQVIFAQSLM